MFLLAFSIVVDGVNCLFIGFWVALLEGHLKHSPLAFKIKVVGMNDIPCPKCKSGDTEIKRGVERDCPYCKGDPKGCMFCTKGKVKVTTIHCNTCGWEF